jgi:hypothetical protein
MGRSYKQCSGCGKQALGIATRCPACGRALLTPAAEEPDRGLGRFLAPAVAAGLLVAAAVFGVANLSRTNGAPNERSSDTAADSTASSQLGYVMAATTRLDTATATALPARSAGQLLVTRTWTNVRQLRTRVADVEAVLLPGDTVFADSLERGWFRVTLEGKVLGYAHHSTLVAPGR